MFFNNLSQSSSTISEFNDSRQPLTIQDTQPRSRRESGDKICRLCLSIESFGEIFEDIFEHSKELAQQIIELSGVKVHFAKFYSS